MKKHYLLAVNGTMEMVEVSKDSWHCVMHDAGKYVMIERLLPNEVTHGAVSLAGNISDLALFMNGTKLVGATFEERSEKEC